MSEDLITKLKRWRSIGLDALTRRHQIWKRNDLYYLGHQWSEDKVRRLPKWRSTPTYNIIFFTIDTLIALVTDQRPQAFAFNRAGGTVRTANVLSSHLEQLHIDLDLEEKDSDCWLDKFITGTSFWKTIWDFDEKVIDSIRVAPENIIPDPLAESIQECRYIFERRIKPISDVLEEYPKLFEEIVNSRDDELQGVFDHQTKQIVRSAKVTVWECWFKDTTMEPVVNAVEDNVKELKKSKRKYPRGRVVTFVGDVVLQDKKNPFKFTGKKGDWPYTKNSLIKQRNEFWGISYVDVMRFQQEEINSLEAMIFDNIKTFTNPIFKAVRGAVDIESFSNSPGALVELDADNVNAFAREPGQNIATDVFRFRDVKIDEIRQLGGVTDALQGSVGASQRPGAVRAAFEASMGRIRKMIRQSNKAFADMGERQIDLMQQFYEVNRLVSLSPSSDDISDLSLPSNNKEVQEALADERVRNELRGSRIDRQIIVPNQQFQDQLSQERGASGVNDESELRKLLKAKGIVEFKDDIRDGRYGYRVDIHSFQPFDKETMFRIATDLLRYGKDQFMDQIGIWELLDLPGKDKLKERLDEKRKLQETIAGLEQQIQQLTSGQNGATPEGQGSPSLAQIG